MQTIKIGKESKPTEDAIAQIGGFGDCPPEVYDLLKKVCRDIEELQFLGKFSIKVIFRKKEKTSKGMRVLGTASVFPERDKLLHPWDALVVLDEAYWAANPTKRKALLCHELCHFDVDAEGNLKGKNHDIEEFLLVLKHFGDWQGDVRRINQTQLEMGFEAL